MLLAIVAGCLLNQEPHFTKRALLIGAWDYRSKVWANLSSKNDVELIQKTLETRFAWTENQGGKIVTLTKREETTRKRILETFRSFLASDLQEGDTLYFHYSGHGYQAADLDPEKDPALKVQTPVNPIIGNAPDGLDETILPTDDPDKNAGQIRNDELGLLIKDLFDQAGKKKVNLLVTLDACHSGGGTRGGNRIVRGKPYDGPIPTRVPVKLDPTDPKVRFLSRVAGYTVMSACRSDQEAGEAVGPDKRGYGRFTLALCEALNKCTPSVTYRQLFDGLDSTMASRWTFGAVDTYSQCPQIEGESNRLVFGAAAQPAPAYFALLQTGKAQFRLKGGALNGINQRSVLRLVDSKDKPLATLSVIRAGLTDSEITSEPTLSSIKPEILTDSRAVLISQASEDAAVGIDISAIKNRADFPEIKQRIADRVPSATLLEQPGEAANLKIEFFSPKRGTSSPSDPSTEGFRIYRRSNGAEVTADATGRSAPIQPNSDAAVLLAENVFSELRYQSICKMANEFAGQREFVELQAVPCQAEEVGQNAYRWLKDAPAITGDWPVGTQFALRFRVRGNWEPYIAVLDLTSDGSVSMLWPHPQAFGESIQVKQPVVSGKRSEEWQYLKAANSDEVAVFRVTPPVGKEILKLVASERPLPFRDLLATTRGSQSGLSPLGKIFGSYASVTKRSQTESADPGEKWSTRQVAFAVKGLGPSDSG